MNMQSTNDERFYETLRQVDLILVEAHLPVFQRPEAATSFVIENLVTGAENINIEDESSKLKLYIMLLHDIKAGCFLPV